MSLYSAKINSKDHNCFMMLVNTESCMALTHTSPEWEREEETEYGLKETKLYINTDLKEKKKVNTTSPIGLITLDPAV